MNAEGHPNFPEVISLLKCDPELYKAAHCTLNSLRGHHQKYAVFFSEPHHLFKEIALNKLGSALPIVSRVFCLLRF